MKSKCVFIAIAMIGLATASADAETGITNIVSGVTSNVTGDYYVGNTGPFNGLIVTNAGQLNVSGSGYMGYTVAASNNTALVTGSGSVWNVNGHLNVGYGTSANNNQLTISAGAHVQDNVGDIGYGGANNSVLITGSGSVWSNVNSSGSAILIVGDQTAGNQLTVANGGHLYNNIGSYIGYNSGASNNTVLVTGSGSVWIADQLAAKYVGYNGSGNSLIVSNGGFFQVGNQGGENGIFIGNGSTANNNSVTINGAGMLAYTKIYVGYNGSGNSLTIANGGVLTNRTDTSQESVNLWVGYNASSSNNSVTVTGPGSLYFSSFSAGYNQIYLGYSGSSNSLTVSAGGEVLLAGTNNDLFSVGYKPGANNNALTITGNNSLLSIQGGDLILGGGPDDGGGPYNAGGSGNQMTIAAGGTVSNINGYIGYNTNAANNAATVSGAGSSWNNSTNLFIGYGTGATNSQLTIANGGQVQDIQGDIGYGGSNNIVLVTGANALWNNSGTLTVGDNTAGNSLTITNGGRVSASKGDIGYNSGANNNTVLVTGSNAVWQNSGNLVVGDQTAGNQLSLANGGVVSNTAGYIGYGGGANSNTVTVSGSVWNNNGDLTVGLSGSGNQLTVSNGASVINANGWIGVNSGANNNSVLVTGSGSVWTNNGNFYIVTGSGNSLTISNGGAVVVTGGSVVESSAANTTLLVTGSNTVWRNTGVLNLYGSAMQLTISAGGQVFNTAGEVRGGDAVNVAGSGSVWNNSGNLLVGSGSGNSLTITNGGAVLVGGNATLGKLTYINNSITVAGGSLAVTNAGATGTLNVYKGTLAINGGTIFADSFFATNGGNSVVQFNGGTLNTKTTTVANGSLFTVGNGVNAAALNLQGGTHAFANGLAIANNAQVCGSAAINAAVTNNGMVSPGASIGTLTVASNYTQNAGGALTLKLGGLGSNDVLAVSRTAQLGGTLTVTNLNGFQPALSNAFTILTAQTVSGAFAATNLPTLDPAGGWSVIYSSTTVVLRVVNGTSAYALWAQAHIPNPSLRNSDQDADGDGLSNWQEYIADTDPTNPASYFHVTAVSNLPPWTVYFQSSTGRMYTLNGISNLVSGVWTNVPGAGPRLGAGGPDSMQDTNVPPKGPFYRLGVALP